MPKGPGYGWGYMEGVVRVNRAGEGYLPLVPAGLEPLAVSALLARIDRCLAGDPLLSQVAVEGEISNLRRPGSGHLYFSLKDANAQIRCVMWRSRNQLLRFRPEDGMSVVAVGGVGLYPAGGDLQLYVEALYPAGRGALHLAFEQLKQKLQAEGLFDTARKRPLPAFPRCVGVVTSPTGAAIRDILTTLRRRFPAVRVLLAPAVVQGEEGPASVCRAIERINRDGTAEVLILARGGGSLEELWTFNTEEVARAIAASRIPVVTGVGHETDFTIADFVADLRAPTPTAAAAAVVPDRSELAGRLAHLAARAASAARGRLAALRRELTGQLERPWLRRPLAPVAAGRQRVDELLERLVRAARRHLQEERRRLRAAADRLESLSPLATLARGYCIPLMEGRPVRRAGQVAPGDRLALVLIDGEVAARVEGVGRAAILPAGVPAVKGETENGRSARGRDGELRGSVQPAAGGGHTAGGR